jgi:predicted Holliday junction resolvase-like endonuclease
MAHRPQNFAWLEKPVDLIVYKGLSLIGSALYITAVVALCALAYWSASS